MFEFHFCVKLNIVHPSADPKAISERITQFRITNETMAGTERRTTSGKLFEPPRKAALTHWGASLHEEDRIYSGDIRLPEFIDTILLELDEYKDLFLDLGKEGDVFLKIGWFSETNHSAEILDSGILKRCGDIGVGIGLYYYAPGTS
jgi:hypothetical protein